MRNWLRPRLYVTRVGDFEAQSPWPDGCRVSVIPDGPVICTECGKDVSEDIVWRGDGPNIKCIACDEANYVPRKAPTGIRKMIQNLSITYDNLWFAYCSRYGKRVEV